MKILDQALVKAYLTTRDEFAFKIIYHRHAQAMWSMAMRLCDGDQSIAEEVTQDAWMRAVQGIEHFEWRSGLRTWLIKIVINRCREHYRSKRVYEPVDAVQDTTPAYEINDTLKLVDRLPEGYRTILLLHDFEGYKHDEIAQMLDIAPGTSKSQLHQARKAFRTIFNPII